MTKPQIIQDGDIFRSKAQTIVNTVNCVGVMGKGIALGFRKRYPYMYDDYAQRCSRGEVRLGQPYLYRQKNDPWILNFPTKDHWRSMSRLADIEAGLDYLLKHYEQWGITSLAMPPLGAGHGGLEWHVVGPTLYRYLTQMNVPVELYVPHGTRHEELQPEYLQHSLTEEPSFSYGRIGPPWIALLEVLHRLELQPYRPMVGRTMFQKLAYFGTALGMDLGIDYRRGSYGPFSPQIKQLISHLLNNGLITEARRGRMLEVRLGKTFEAAERAVGADLRRYEDAIDQLVDLFSRMSTADAEVAATVHFAWAELAAERPTPPTEMDVVNAVMEWKKRRKPPLSRSAVAEAARNLNLLRWIDAVPSSGIEADPALRLS